MERFRYKNGMKRILEVTTLISLSYRFKMKQTRNEMERMERLRHNFLKQYHNNN
jgi:hypothetical protein